MDFIDDVWSEIEGFFYDLGNADIPWGLVIFEGIIGILFIICLCGLVLSIIKKNKIKKLSKNSDLVLQTKNGLYEFKYIIKGFKSENGYNIAIITSPVLGFTDLAHSQTNSATSGKIVVSNLKTSEVGTVEENLDGLNPRFVICVPNSAFVGNKLSLDITYTTKWYLGGREVMDKVNFKYEV